MIRTAKLGTREFVTKSLRAWRVRVYGAHAASLLLGLLTALLGLVIGPVMQILFAPTGGFLPWDRVLGPLLSQTFEDYLPPAGLDTSLFVSRLPWLLMGIATLKALTTFYQWYTWEWLGEQLGRLWRGQVAEMFIHLKNESRDDGLLQKQEDQLGGMVAQDIRVLREFVVHYYGGLPREGLQVFFTGAVLLMLSPKLFGIFVICIAPVGALLSRFGRRIRKRASRALNDHSVLSEWIQQRLLGIETIKHYKVEALETMAMTVASENLFERFRSAVRLKSRTSPMIEAFGVLAMSIALWVAFHDIAVGALSGAVVMSFFASLALFAQAAAKLGRYINSNQDGRAAGERLLTALSAFELHLDKAMAETRHQTNRQGRRNELIVSNITLKYGQKTVLQNLSYNFDGGKLYCLVGKSGAGKSSLFNALLGLRKPSDGQIDLRIAEEWGPASVELVSIPQTVPTVPTTLERNVSYPDLVADTARAEHALEQAHFKLAKDRLSDALKTYVGPGYVQLSGGEAQRLQLARLYYHNSPFVLVDEGTSALDPVTEAEVLRSLRQVAQRGACVIMIAHRRAAAEAADEVLLMDQGRIALAGKPADVLKSKLGETVFG